MTQSKTPFDHFLTHDYTKATKEQQIAYLKKHEEEMTNYIKSQNSKIMSVQWDWDSVEIETGGGPIENERFIQISGNFNNIKDSSATLIFSVTDRDFPDITTISSTQPLRVGGEIYE